MKLKAKIKKCDYCKGYGEVIRILTGSVVRCEVCCGRGIVYR